MFDSTEREALGRKYQDLKELYNDPVGNADAITKLIKFIKDLELALSGKEDKKNKESGTEYSDRYGVPLTKKEIQERDEARLRKKNSSDRQEEPASEGYTSEDRERLRRKITGAEDRYATDQVGCLTGLGEPVPAGTKELGDFLDNHPERPVSFSYLMTPNKSDPSRNHFVSLNISADGTITYLDPNGELMRDAERDVLLQKISGGKIAYRNHQGEQISEAAAKANPTTIGRVQFDDSSCGLYSVELTNLMKEAGGDEAKIKQGLKAIKDLDTQTVRQQHTGCLDAGISASVGKAATQMGAPLASCAAEARQTEGGVPHAPRSQTSGISH
jgi:hypothetical protein